LIAVENIHGAAWKRISPVGQTPGAMTNISLAEANGMIYVFGSSEGKSVLWVYNISKGCPVIGVLKVFCFR